MSSTIDAWIQGVQRALSQGTVNLEFSETSRKRQRMEAPPSPPHTSASNPEGAAVIDVGENVGTYGEDQATPRPLKRMRINTFHDRKTLGNLGFPGDRATSPSRYSSSGRSSNSSASCCSSPAKSAKWARERRQLLADAVPSIIFRQACFRPDEECVFAPVIEQVLLSFSTGRTNVDFIPRALKDHLSSFRGEAFPDSVFSDKEISLSELDGLKLFVSEVVAMSAQYHDDDDDESAWCDLVGKILRRTCETTLRESVSNRTIKRPMMVCEPAMTKKVDPKFFPISNGAVDSVKVDFLLQYNPSHGTVRALHEKIKARDSSFLFSPMKDVTSARKGTFCPIEVKAPFGNYAQASVQCALVTAANIKKTMLNGAFCIPCPFLIVVGHQWSLQWAFSSDDTHMQIYGPIPIGGTSNTRDVFQLVQVLELLIEYGMKDYWDWFCGQLEGL